MKSIEFCYWLQGFFEISESHEFKFNLNQLNCIERHVDLVIKYESPNISKSYSFVCFLKNYLIIKEETVSYTGRIQQILQDIFIHEIDNSYGDHSMIENLNQIHNVSPFHDGTMIRC